MDAIPLDIIRRELKAQANCTFLLILHRLLINIFSWLALHIRGRGLESLRASTGNLGMQLVCARYLYRVRSEEYHRIQAKSHLVRNARGTVAYFRDVIWRGAPRLIRRISTTLLIQSTSMAYHQTISSRKMKRLFPLLTSMSSPQDTLSRSETPGRTFWVARLLVL